MLASMTTRFLVLSFIAWFAACGQAVAIECPKAGNDTYVLSSSQKRLLTKGTYIDLVNEIDELSASLKTQKPDISTLASSMRSSRPTAPLSRTCPL